jgi:hypothetical protein
VASVFTPEIQDVRRIAEPNRLAYCRRHGYTYVPTHETLAPDRPPAWSKVELVRRVLRDRPDVPWVLWLDADALVMRPEVEATRFVKEAGAAGADLVIGTDRNGINSGVFFLRNCPAAMRFLELVWARTECVFGPWWEQGAMAAVMAEHPSLLRVRVADRRAFNAYPHEADDGSFIVHFTDGFHGPKRVPAMRAWAAAGGRPRYAMDLWHVAPPLTAADLAAMAAMVDVADVDGRRLRLVRRGHNGWPVRLAADGIVAAGASADAAYWWVQGEREVVLAGADGRVTARLERRGEGVWDGASVRTPGVWVELRPER